MTVVPRNVTDEELLALVRSWIDLLAAGDYVSAISRFGYSFSEDPNPDCILSHLRSYRSEEWYPGEKTFTVTDWKTAKLGNPFPEQKVEWYLQPAPLAGAVSYDLPLNGRWSDLTADFVLYQSGDDGYIFVLEEICPGFHEDTNE